MIKSLNFRLNRRFPPPPSNFDAGIVQSAFTKLHELLDKFQGRRTPPREYLGSDRRSPTAGPSDIARPNPLAQVSDTASQGPDSAPGPSTATHVPPSSGPSHHDAPSSSEFVSARVGGDEWEHVRAWSRRVSSSERLRDELERTHAEISQLRDMIEYCRAHARAPPDHFYRDLDILHSKYDQLSLALAESRQAFAPSRHGRSPVVASPSVASPSDAPRPPRSDSSPFKGLRLSPQPGPSSSGDHRFALQDRRRPRDVSSDFPRRSRFSEERFRERRSDSQRFASRDSPSPKRRRFASKDSLSPKRQGFASRDSLSPKRQGFASRDSLSPKRQRFTSKDSPLQSDSDSLQGTPILQIDGDSLQGILIHLSVSTHLVPLLVMVLLRGPHRGLLLPVHLHLLGRIRKLRSLLFQPQSEL